MTIKSIEAEVLPVREAEDEVPLLWLEDLTPRQIVAELDKYIVGQDEAKKAVAIALRNRWRRQRVEDELRDEILPNNLILIGPTGVGKTEIARRLARLAGAPFVKVEASKFTEVGYVGRDVESMIRDLVDTSVNMVRAEREDEVQEEAERRVEEKLLDLLLPPVEERRRPSAPVTLEADGPKIFVAGPQGVHEQLDGASADDEAESVESRRARTRDKLRSLLKDGKLEDRDVEVEIQQTPSLDGMMIPMGGMEGMDHNFTEMLQEMLPKRTKRRSVTVAEARRILVQDELDRLVDMDEVVNEALNRAEDMGMIFLDEIDKIAGQRGGMGPDVSREGSPARPPARCGGLKRSDQIRARPNGPHPVHRRRRVSRLEAERPHSRASGALPDPCGAPQPRRRGLQAYPTRAEERAPSAISGVDQH